jgi:hypothetical protein
MFWLRQVTSRTTHISNRAKFTRGALADLVWATPAATDPATEL